MFIYSSRWSSHQLFLHVYGERKDVNPLVVEYEGDSWQDYPDPNYSDPQFTKS